MPTFRGVVRLNPLEGGIWELHADDGKRYQLSGGDGGLHRDGQRVEVDGKVDKGAMSFGMIGPVLAVKSYKVV